MCVSMLNLIIKKTDYILGTFINIIDLGTDKFTSENVNCGILIS